MGIARGAQVEHYEFIEGTYAPLPTIVEAARRIFRDEPLPRLRRADSYGLEGTVDYVKEFIAQTSREGGRRLILSHSRCSPSGKTLAGLRTVYEGEAPPGGGNVSLWQWAARSGLAGCVEEHCLRPRPSQVHSRVRGQRAGLRPSTSSCSMRHSARRDRDMMSAKKSKSTPLNRICSSRR